MEFSRVKLIVNIPKNTKMISKSNLSYLHSVYYSIFVLYKMCNLQKLCQVHNKFQMHIVIAILQIIKHQKKILYKDFQIQCFIYPWEVGVLSQEIPKDIHQSLKNLDSSKLYSTKKLRRCRHFGLYQVLIKKNILPLFVSCA